MLLIYTETDISDQCDGITGLCVCLCVCVLLPCVICKTYYSMSIALVASLPAVEELDESQYVKCIPGVITSPRQYMTSQHHSAGS